MSFPVVSIVATTAETNIIEYKLTHVIIAR